VRPSRASLSLALLLAAAPLRANSMVTHVWVAEQSIERVTAPGLAAIVRDPALRAVIQNGAIYPDSGYSVRHEYGEWAHWESFHEPYLQWIRSRWGAEGYTSPDARRHVAFLMGNAAHGMTDQTFDQYFMPRVRSYDRTNADDLDVGSDTWLIVEHGVQSAADGQFWFDEMPMIHAAVNGPAVTPAVLREAAQLTGGATRFLTQFGWSLYTMRWRQMPWAASHYMDEGTPGAYPHLVRVNAAYWDFLWQRLQGTAPPGAAPLYSWPASGQTNFAVAHTDVESRMVITTPWGLENSSVNDRTVRVLGPGDAVVPVRVGRYGDHGNTLMLTLEQDLAFNTPYRIELTAQLRTLEGSLTGVTNVIPFRTRCAADHLGDCAPVPTPRPTLRDPPVSDPRPRPDAGVPVVVMVDDAGRPEDAPTLARDAGNAGDLGAPIAREATGCGCATAPPRGSAVGVVGWLLALGVRRRRRSVRGA
jgi:MYXO-CTERM domain-containing protein